MFLCNILNNLRYIIVTLQYLYEFVQGAIGTIAVN